MKHFLFLAAAILLAASAHAQTKLSSQTTASQAGTASAGTVNTTAKRRWLAQASGLSKTLATLGSNTLNKSVKSDKVLIVLYTSLATKLGVDETTYPDPSTTSASALRPKLAEWLEDVQASKYDNRFVE